MAVQVNQIKTMKGYTMEALLLDIAKGETVNTLMESFSDASDKGRLLDGLSRAVVVFRASPVFANAEMLVGNSNKSLRTLRNVRVDFLQSLVNNSCGNGTSDVSFAIGDTLYLCSCKYFKQVKSIDSYDIAGLTQLWQSRHSNDYNNVKYAMFVRDKSEFEEMFYRSNKKDLYTDKVVHIFGVEELEQMVSTMHDLFQRMNIKTGEALENLLCDMFDISRSPLSLRFHQNVCLSRTMEIQDCQKSPSPILWAMLPRSGKSYITAGHILESIRRGKQSFLIISPVPNETFPQFKEDIFDKMIEFANIDLAIGNEIQPYMKQREEKIKKNQQVNPFVMMISKQHDNSACRIKGMGVADNYKFDVIYSDENHCGGTTLLAKTMIKSYSDPMKTQLILMSATYNKPYHEWNITESHIVYWDLDSLEAARQGDTKTLVELYGVHAKQALTTHSSQSLIYHYGGEPRMCLMSAYHREDLVAKFRSNYTDKQSTFGADIKRIFSINNAKQFANPDAVSQLLDIIFGRDPYAPAPQAAEHKYEGILTTVKRHANVYGGRGMDTGLSQMWFLPYGEGCWIDDTSRELKKAIENHAIGKHYHVACLNESTNMLRDFVAEEEKIAQANKKKGTILLAGNRGSMGISLKKVDIVFLLTHSKSADDIYQKLYRCMTRDDATKKYGYVIDLDVHRVLNTLMLYESSRKKHKADNTMKQRILELSQIVELCDIFRTEFSRDNIVEELHELWRNDVSTRLSFIDRKMNALYIDFDEKFAQQMREIIQCTPTGSNSVNKTYITNEEERKLPISTSDKIPLPFTTNIEDELVDQLENIHISEQSGASETASEQSDNQTNDTETNEDVVKNIADVLPTIVCLCAVITCNKSGSEWNGIENMLQSVYADSQLCAMFEEQCDNYWNISDLVKFKEIILSVVQNLNPSNLYKIKEFIECVRESMIHSLEKKKELLEYLQEVLKPKEIEKKRYGEVFTPLSLVEEMLDTLPKKVWTDSTLKWFDPAVGIGNFMVCVYYRLMEGLQHEIPDEAERKKHIITEMLYMSEINKKNVHVSRLIFGDNANIHQGDTLVFNPIETWNIEKGQFDIVLGNPPYNTAHTRAGSSPLYNKFVEAYINTCTYMLYVIPARWFSGGKGLDTFRANMLKRSDIMMMKYIEKSMTVFGSNVNVEGGVCYFLKNANYQGLCMFNNELLDMTKFDILIENKYHSLIQHIASFVPITTIYKPQDYYHLQTNDKRLVKLQNNQELKCYVSKQKGYIKYIDKNYLENKTNVNTNTYKVITAEANGAYKCFGNTFIGYPNEVHTKSYISFHVQSEDEAKSLLSYMKLRLPNFMLMLRKISQHISASTCKWIPLPSLDRIWETDNQIYEYFNLTQEHIDLIEQTTIKGYT